MDIFELEDDLDLTKGIGFCDKLLPMLNMFTQTNGQEEKGRPQKEVEDLTDGGQESRATGSNLEKGGTI
jgi:hypothetical protein